MEKVKEGTVITVNADGAGQRLDQWLAAHLPHTSRSQIQRLVKEGRVALNGGPCRSKDPVHAGDRITVKPADVASVSERAQSPLAILFEDAAVIVVNKPAGLAVHPGAGSPQPTLVAAILDHVGRGIDPRLLPSDRPGVVHRIDKQTSGVLVCAKTLEAQAHLQAQFKEKSTIRRYMAILDGAMTMETQICESYLSRDPHHRLRFRSRALNAPVFGEGGTERFAKTEFRRECVYAHKLTRVSAVLATGRTHQIRVHAKSMNMPVLCDPVYGRSRDLPKVFSRDVKAFIMSHKGQMLHAMELGFRHPTTGQALSFTAPPPEAFQTLLDLLEPYSDGPIL